MTSLAMLLMGTSAALYTIEYVCTFEYFAGLIAAVLLTIGLTIGLVSAGTGLPAPLIIAAGLLMGLVIAWLCRTAKRARLNKIHDL